MRGDDFDERVAAAYDTRWGENLTTQDEQVECCRDVAAHLEPGGSFVIEVIVPTLRRLPPGERVQAFAVSPTHLGFDEFVDVVGQISVSHHYWVTDGDSRHSRRPSAPCGPRSSTSWHDSPG